MVEETPLARALKEYAYVAARYAKDTKDFYTETNLDVAILLIEDAINDVVADKIKQHVEDGDAFDYEAARRNAWREDT